METAGAASVSNGMDSSRRGWLRELLRASGDAADAAAAEQLEELEREIALLREENARLKVAREHAADRPLNELMRAAFEARGEADADGEDPWEVLTECMLLRHTLLGACEELERGAGELRVRIETLLAEPEGSASPERVLERVT
jgi:transposase-like protein